MNKFLSFFSKIFGISKNAAIIACIAMILSVVGGAVYGLRDLGNDISDLFKDNPLTIDETFNVVEEIHKIGEFTTATFYQEDVIYKTKKKDELVLIIRGKVRVGFDLSNISNGDIIVYSQTIKLRLPQVKIFDIITNPSGYETFEENGKWSFEEITEYKKEARDIIEKNALESGILQLAENTAIEKLTTMLQILGFKEVIIELKYPSGISLPVELNPLLETSIISMENTEEINEVKSGIN
jgi:hypothetical protein